MLWDFLIEGRLIMSVCMVVISNLRRDPRVYKEAKTLVENGYEVIVITVNEERKSTGLENMDGIKVIEIPLRSFEHKFTFYRRVRNLLSRIKFRLTLSKRVFFIKADIYHAHNINTLLVTFLAARFRRKRLILDVHELWTEQAPQTKDIFLKIEKVWGQLLERLLINHVDRVITVNESIAQVLSSRHHLPVPLVLMNCAYTLPHERSDKLRQRLSLNDDTKIILYQGGYYYETRALENLVLSAQFISKGIIVFIGFGSSQKLESLIEEKKLASKVKILNTVPSQGIHEYISSADVGVIPFLDNNLNSHFASPNKLFEYLMGGVAIATSDLPVIRKVIEESSAGGFFDPFDPKDIARAINEIIEDEDKLEKMKKNARQTALTRYNWEMESRKLLDLYKNIVSCINQCNITE